MPQAYAKSSWEFTKICSWYGGKLFHGNETSSGIIYNQNNPHQSAYNKWPLGTVFRVTNPENNQTIITVVVDHTAKETERKDRIDLSLGAAKKLGYKEDGLLKAKVEILMKPKKDLPKAQVALLVKNASKMLL